MNKLSSSWAPNLSTTTLWWGTIWVNESIKLQGGNRRAQAFVMAVVGFFIHNNRPRFATQWYYLYHGSDTNDLDSENFRHQAQICSLPLKGGSLPSERQKRETSPVSTTQSLGKYHRDRTYR